MTVRELILKLIEIQDKNLQVCCYETEETGQLYETKAIDCCIENRVDINITAI